MRVPSHVVHRGPNAPGQQQATASGVEGHASAQLLLAIGKPPVPPQQQLVPSGGKPVQGPGFSSFSGVLVCLIRPTAQSERGIIAPIASTSSIGRHIVAFGAKSIKIVG